MPLLLQRGMRTKDIHVDIYSPEMELAVRLSRMCSWWLVPVSVHSSALLFGHKLIVPLRKL